MFGRIEAFSIAKWHQFTNRLLHGSRRLSANGLCSISLTGKELIIVSGQYHEQKIKLEVCESYQYDNLDNIKALLSMVVKKNKLKMRECIWVLQPEEYQLFTIDALRVDDSEFQDAIRWKIKDLTNYPIDDVIVDRFTIPKGNETTAKMTIVVAQTSYLQAISEKLLASGLDLTVIDIPELALRNVTALFEDDKKPTAVLYMQEKLVEFLITFQKQIYFTRRLTVDLNLFSDIKSQNNNDATNSRLKSLEKMAIEIQRSLDYCQSQWRLAVPERFFLISTRPWSDEDRNYLSQRCNMPLVALDLEQMIVFDKNLTQSEQAQYILELGGILRTEN